MDLRACPFCGGEAEVIKQGSVKQSMIVHCTNCGCLLESGDISGMTEDKHLAWNTRADESIRREVIEECAKIIEQHEREHFEHVGHPMAGKFVPYWADELRAIATDEDSS